MIEEFNTEAEEILNMSSLIEIHKRLEEIEVLQQGHLMAKTGIKPSSGHKKF